MWFVNVDGFENAIKVVRPVGVVTAKTEASKNVCESVIRICFIRTVHGDNTARFT